MATLTRAPEAAPPPRSSSPAARPFPWPQAAILAVFAVLFLGVLGEIGLRLGDLRSLRLGPDPRCAGAALVLDGQQGIFRLDPDAGYRMQPNACLRLRSTEFDEVLRTNARGFVGPDVPDVKPAGELRVVVLGDSFTAGGQVPYDALFTVQLERLLRDAGRPNVRVVNAGVGGWSTVNQAGFLRANLDWLQPDLVVVASFVGNDLGENVLATLAGYQVLADHPDGLSFGEAARDLVVQSQAWFPQNGVPLVEAGRYTPGAPLPTPAANTTEVGTVANRSLPGPIPEWVRDPSPSVTARNLAKWAWDGLRERSRLLGGLFGLPGRPGTTTAPGTAPSKSQIPLSVASYEWTLLKDPPRAYWLDATFPLFGQYLGQVRQAAASVGAPTVLLLIPPVAQVDAASQRQVMADYRLQEAQLDWERPQREMRAAAEQAGVRDVVDLQPVFRQQPDPATLYFTLDQHFRPSGHTLAATTLARYLTDGGLVGPR